MEFAVTIEDGKLQNGHFKLQIGGMEVLLQFAICILKLPICNLCPPKDAHGARRCQLIPKVPTFLTWAPWGILGTFEGRLRRVGSCPPFLNVRSIMVGGSPPYGFTSLIIQCTITSRSQYVFWGRVFLRE
jgi:hypothetical protein